MDPDPGCRGDHDVDRALGSEVDAEIGCRRGDVHPLPGDPATGHDESVRSRRQAPQHERAVFAGSRRGQQGKGGIAAVDPVRRARRTHLDADVGVGADHRAAQGHRRLAGSQGDPQAGSRTGLVDLDGLRLREVARRDHDDLPAGMRERVAVGDGALDPPSGRMRCAPVRVAEGVEPDAIAALRGHEEHTGVGHGFARPRIDDLDEEPGARELDDDGTRLARGDVEAIRLVAGRRRGQGHRRGGQVAEAEMTVVRLDGVANQTGLGARARERPGRDAREGRRLAIGRLDASRDDATADEHDAHGLVPWPLEHGGRDDPHLEALLQQHDPRRLRWRRRQGEAAAVVGSGDASGPVRVELGRGLLPRRQDALVEHQHGDARDRDVARVDHDGCRRSLRRRGRGTVGGGCHAGERRRGLGVRCDAGRCSARGAGVRAGRGRRVREHRDDPHGERDEDHQTHRRHDRLHAHDDSSCGGWRHDHARATAEARQTDPRAAIHCVGGVGGRPKTREPSLDPRLCRLHGDAQPSGHLTRRKPLVEAQEERRAVGLGLAQQGFDEPATDGFALCDLRDVRHLGARGDESLPATAPPACAQLVERTIPRDAPQPPANGSRLPRRALQRGDPRVLHHVLDSGVALEDRAGDTADERLVGQQGLGGQRRHRPPLFSRGTAPGETGSDGARGVVGARDAGGYRPRVRSPDLLSACTYPCDDAATSSSAAIASAGRSFMGSSTFARAQAA